MILFIICTSVFILSLIIVFACMFADLDEIMFIISIISLALSGIGMIVFATSNKQDIKAIEYPASKYDFKTKVVEFKEHRDTILVVTPKEKIK